MSSVVNVTHREYLKVGPAAYWESPWGASQAEAEAAYIRLGHTLPRVIYHVRSRLHNHYRIG